MKPIKVRTGATLLSLFTITAAAWWPSFEASSENHKRGSLPVSTRDGPRTADLKSIANIRTRHGLPESCLPESCLLSASINVHSRPGAFTAEDHRKHRQARRSIAERAAKNTGQALTPELEELKTLIETNARFHLYFTQMFDQVPSLYTKDIAGNPLIRDYEHLLQALNLVVTNPPPQQSLPLPIYDLLAFPLGTTSGFAAFVDPEVNELLHRMLSRWGAYLKTNNSASDLTTQDGDWLAPTVLASFAATANAPFNTTRTFEQIFECDPGADHYGFNSWNDFFTRQFRPGLRPIASPDDDDIIVSACESRPVGTSKGVQLRDKFWAKGQPYSLVDMLGNETIATSFVNGTVFQAFLSAESYHRWHSPISGTVRYAYNIQGTYYSNPLFASFDGLNASDFIVGETAAIDGSRSYLSAMATRAVVVLEADDPKIGLVAFIAIGMEEISSCEITVKIGQHVKKGDETGSFHYGGSSYALIFQPGLDLVDFPAPNHNQSAPNVPLGAKLAGVSSSTRK